MVFPFWGFGPDPPLTYTTAILWVMECLRTTVSYHIFMNNYVTTFCLFNNIWVIRVLNKNRLHKYTIVGDKQPQRKTGMWPLWTTHIKQKKQCWFKVVGLNNNRALYIAFSKFSEPKRFVQRLSKVQGKCIQEQKPN